MANTGKLFLGFLQVGNVHTVSNNLYELAGWVIEGKKGAAKALGLAPSSLRSKMRRLGIVRPSRAKAS